MSFLKSARKRLFQSTPPMRRATFASMAQTMEVRVSIHAPHAEGDTGNELPDMFAHWFQSTPPMRRATGLQTSELPDRWKFQSTPPMRRATLPSPALRLVIPVSIHAPHAEGDDEPLALVQLDQVSIHAPHAEGDAVAAQHVEPVRVSIHAPHAEGDSTHQLAYR